MSKRTDESLRGARREAEKINRKAILDAREETLEIRTKAENDMRSRKGQLAKREKDVKAAQQEQVDVEFPHRHFEVARHAWLASQKRDREKVEGWGILRPVAAP